MSLFSISRSALALLLIAFSAATYAADAPLSLNEALRLAEKNAPQLAAAQYALRGNEAMAIAARELPDPQLALGVDNVPVDGPDRGSLTRDFMTQRRVGVMQEFISQDKRDLKAEVFLADAKRDAALGEVARATLQRETANAWLALAIDRRARRDVDAALTESARQAKALEQSVASGKISATATLTARLALVQMQDRATDLERDMARAEAVLTRYIGAAAQRPNGDLPDIRTLPLSESHLKELVEHHPDLASAQGEIDAATAQARLADLATRPDWSAQVYYAQRGPSYSNMAGIEFRFALPLFPERRQYQERSARLARVEELSAQREAMTRAHRAEIAAWVADWRAAREKTIRIEQEILPLAKQRIALADAEYGSGRMPLETVLDSRKALLDSMIAQRDAERELARTWSQLEFLIAQRITP